MARSTRTTDDPPPRTPSLRTSQILSWFGRAKSGAVSGAPEPAAPAAPPAPVVPVSVSRRCRWFNRLGPGGVPGCVPALVIACAGLSLGIYLAGTLRFPLAAHLSPPPLDIGKLTSLAPGEYSPFAGDLFLLAIGVLFAAWGLACVIARRVEHQARTGRWPMPWPLRCVLFGFPPMALLVLLFMYPVTAIDVFDYASQIRVLTIYHGNPLTIPPSAFPQDPFLPYNGWQAMPASYGPLWVVLSALASQPAGNQFFYAVLNQKLLTIAACLGCMVFIWLLGKRVCPERRWQAWVFFAWNPLVLFETGANGHNDAIMDLFMLAGLMALLSSRRYWQSLALPLLVASVLVKWTTALLIPLAVVYLLRGGRTRHWGLGPLGIGATLSTALAIALIAPFWDPHHSWAVVQQAGLFTSSPLALLHSLLTPIYPPGNGRDPAGTAVHAIGLGLFALVYLWLLARLALPRLRPRLLPDARLSLPQRLIATGLESYFWYFVLATFWFQPWYLIALLPLAALDPRFLARIRSALFALGSALSYVVYVFLWIISLRQGPVFTVELVACSAIYAPPLFTRMLENWYARLRLYEALSKRPRRKPLSASPERDPGEPDTGIQLHPLPQA